MFGAIFGSRAYAYEIYVQVDGRWRLDKRLEGQAGLTQLGNEQLEKSAIAQANALLNMGDFSAVKVVRTRSRSDGFTTQSEIFNKTATARPKAMTVRPFKRPFFRFATRSTISPAVLRREGSVWCFENSSISRTPLPSNCCIPCSISAS